MLLLTHGIPIMDGETIMLDLLVVSEYDHGKNLIASAYLKDMAGEHFNIECAGFKESPLSPLFQIMMKLEGFDLSNCKDPVSVFELEKQGKNYDIVITVCPKRLAQNCPDFSTRIPTLNWPYSAPDKVAESRIDRLQHARILRDSIKADVVQFIEDFKSGKLGDFQQPRVSQ